MKLKKGFYMVLGCIGLGLGALGAALPFLPTVPFFMLSAYCFARSSKKIYKWFMGAKLYKNNLESFVKRKGMTWKTKLRIIIIVTITMTFGFIMMSSVPMGRTIICVVWVFHMVYFIFGIKTIQEENMELTRKKVKSES